MRKKIWVRKFLSYGLLVLTLIRMGIEIISNNIEVDLLILLYVVMNSISIDDYLEGE